ncbi:MAG: hypothetical protein WCD77_03985 [Acidobacteriaceae bacterium]
MRLISEAIASQNNGAEMSGRMRYRPWSVLATMRDKLWPTRIRWTKDEIYPLVLITLAALIVMLVMVWLGFRLVD